MSTITTINASDLITNSRSTINTNFANLNTDKIETSVIDTDTAMAANSDAKIPSQKAVKAYIDNVGGANASETVRGVVEEATDAEVTAGTATGGTGAKLVVTPAKLATRLASLVAPTALTIIPRPIAYNVETNTTQILFNDNTLGHIGLISIPTRITVNKFSVRTGATVPAVAGTMKIALYSEDGQTQYMPLTLTAMSVANTMYSTTVSAVSLAPGQYWLLCLANGTFSGRLNGWETTTENTIISAPSVEFNKISSEPSLCGTYTCSASTLPTTVTIASITDTQTVNRIPRFRLDN